MIATYMEILRLLPRTFIERAVALVLCVAVVSVAAPAAAKPSKVKLIRKELVAIEAALDSRHNALELMGAEWDRAAATLESPQRTVHSFAAAAVAGAQQGHLESLIQRARDAIFALEARRERTIRQLETIVLERQAERFGNAPVPPPSSSLKLSGSLVTYSADWEATAMCESSGRWHIDAYFDGGLQFLESTWIEFGGGEFARYAYEASKIQQIAVAERVLAIQGPKAWPNCWTPLPADA